MMTQFSQRTMTGILGASLLGMSLWGASHYVVEAWADPPVKATAVDPAVLAAQRTALAHWNGLIGGWRGTGQPRRGSPTGAWREDAAWAWSFSESETALVSTITKGKLATTLKMTAGPAEGAFTLVWTSPEGTAKTLAGKIEEGKLVCTSEPDDKQEVHRITLTALNEQRTLILFEKRRSEQQSYSRVAEVGYTREGTRLAAAGGGQPECVVTGGLGTIPVQHAGKTYYVCCTGCKQAFDDNPEGILAEYQARREKEKAKK